MSELPADDAALRAEIANTRAELGHTVEALAAKADVKERVHEAVGDARERVQGTLDDAKDHAHDTVDRVAYQVGRSREKVVSVIGPRWPVFAAASVGLVLLLVGLRLRGRRR
jgi:hypothetical protein